VTCSSAPINQTYMFSSYQPTPTCASNRLWALDRKTFRRIVCYSTQKSRLLHEGFLERVPILVRPRTTGKPSPLWANARADWCRVRWRGIAYTYHTDVDDTGPRVVSC
jgi:hypothetical protein